MFDRIVELGQLHGKRVLDLGCGTGRLSRALEERAHAPVWAVDPSAEMVARAKTLGVNARVARAEALPFKRDWFDAAVARMSVHLFDRTRAFAEVERILAPTGCLVIATLDPDSLDESWLAPYFPTVPEIDRVRFPSEEALRAELAAAGLTELRVERLSQPRTMPRERALEVIRSRAYSTFDHLSPEAHERGLALAERGLPDPVDYRFDWLLAVASH